MKIEDARKLVAQAVVQDDPLKMIDDIYRAIEREAKRCRTELDFDLKAGLTRAQAQRVASKLKRDGFIVTLLSDKPTVGYEKIALRVEWS